MIGTTAILWIVAAALWVAFVLVLAFRRDGSGRTVKVKTRDVSGIIVGGDVGGDVVQNQPAPVDRPQERIGFWDRLGRAGVVVGILGSLATIAALVVTLSDKQP